MALPNDSCHKCGIPIPDGHFYCSGCLKEFEFEERTQMTKYHEEVVEDEPECQGWYSSSVPSRRFKKSGDMIL